MKRNLLLALVAMGGTAFAQTAQRADEAIQMLVEVPAKIERAERNATYPAGVRVSEAEVVQNIERRIRMAAHDVISNFVGRIHGHYASQQEICADVKLLDEAVKRRLDKALRSNASPAQKSYASEEFLRREPAVEALYTTIGTCALQSWIDSPAKAPKK